MRGRTAVAMAILMSIVVAGLLIPTPAVADTKRLVVIDSAWGSLNNPVDVRAGTKDASLVVQVLNNSTDSISGLVLCADLSHPFINSTGGSSVCRAVGGTYGSKDTFTATFRVDVADDAKPGVYMIPIEVHYNISKKSGRIGELIEAPAVISEPLKMEILDVGWGSPDSPSMAWPGDTAAKLYLRVRNPNDEAVHGLKATVENRKLFDTSPPRIYSSDAVATLESGGVATLDVVVGINATSPPGIYDVNVTLEFMDSNGAHMEQRNAVKVVITGRDRVMAHFNPAECVQGCECTLNASIMNEGTGPAVDVEASLSGSPTSPQQSSTGLQRIIGGAQQPRQTSSIIVMSVPRIYLGRLDAGENRTVSFRLYAGSSMAVGAYQMTLTISYTRYDGSTDTITYSVPAEVRPWISPVDVFVEKFVLSRNRIDSVILGVVNNGSSALEDLVLQASLVRQQGFGTQGPQEALEESPRIFRLGTLSPSSTKSVKLDLASISQSDSAVTVKLQLTYRDGRGNYRQETRDVDLLAASRPMLDIRDISTLPGVPCNGSTVIIQGRLINRGVGDALNTRIYLSAPHQLEILEDSHRFIGSVSTDSPTRFSLKLHVPRTITPGTYIVNITAEYMDSLGDWYVVSRGIPMRVEITHVLGSRASEGGLLGQLKGVVNSVTESHLLQAIWAVVITLIVLAAIAMARTRHKGIEEIPGLEAS